MSMRPCSAATSTPLIVSRVGPAGSGGTGALDGEEVPGTAEPAVDADGQEDGGGDHEQEGVHASGVEDVAHHGGERLASDQAVVDQSVGDLGGVELGEV